MPSMFSRRRASSQPPRLSGPPSSSAAIAASSAFLQSSTSTASLSSAAAAAALRSHTTSPEPIGNIQTKRMIRRDSQSSIGSSGVTGRPGAGRGMVRRDSNASMTERTFRSPSPGRSDAVAPAADAPPVPAIPKSARRASSLEPTMRMMSPTPRKSGRNASVDRTTYTSPGRGQAAATAAALASTASNELKRDDSQRSVNFSRPMSPGPPAPARPQSAAGWFSSPKVGTGSPRTTAADKRKSAAALSSTQAHQIERDMQNVANKPVLKKKKKAVEANQGERLANGTMHAGPTGTAVRSAPSPSPAAPPSPAAQPTAQANAADETPVKKKKSKTTPSVDTEPPVAPPPRNPARPSAGADGARSPSSPRAAGLLHKQPSVVREDPEAENMAEQGLSVAKRDAPGRAASVRDSRRTISTSEGPAIAYVAPDAKVHQRAVSLDIPRQSAPNRSPQRHHAHFSDVIVVNDPNSRHQPPPRSVSPFKSALKHSPSSSIRGNSPAAGPNGSLVPASDTSDTTSLTSQDGAKAGKKKKKSVRVSFDDGGTPVSVPANVATPNTSKPIRRELSPAAAYESDTDETMTPRPTLPSFGSVRARKSPSPEVVEKITETVTSSTSTSIATLPDRSELSNDHAVGAVLANAFAEKHRTESNAPLSEQLTSVDESGDVSDVSEEFQDSSPKMANGLNSTPLEPHTEHKEAMSVSSAPSVTHSSKDAVMARVISSPVMPAPESTSPTVNLQADQSAVPDINVLPATPGVEEDGPILDSSRALPTSAKRYSIPGGWDESEESKSDPTVASRARPITTEEPDFESSDEDDTLDAPIAPVERHSPLLEPIYESDSDNSDAFSDAAEDPSEFDGNGFASLDAMVESPIQSSFPRRDISTPPHSPSTRLPAATSPASPPSTSSSAEPVMAAGGDWSYATAYWSSLTRERKEQMERQAQPTEETEPVLQQPKQKKRTQAPAAMALPVTEPVQLPPESPRNSSEQPAARKPALKKTMRQPIPPVSTAGETHMRTSMRSGAGGSMKTSLRQEPTSRSPVNNEPRGALQKKRIPAAPSPSSVGAATAAARNPPVTSPAKVSSAPTDDSDSESSFKKQKRRGSVSTIDSQGGRYSMKRSMRGSSVDVGVDRRPLSPTPAPRGSGRFSVRSLSPNGSFMGNATKGETIRTSLRGGPANDVPTMRGKNSKALRDSKSPTLFGMSGFSKPNSRPASIAAPPASSGARASGMFKSRFVDSDDEDDNEPSSGMGFRSRFADSDEEESPIGPPKRMPGNLAPVRGIPRKQSQYDNDSTDLDDSDEDTGKTKRPSSRVPNKPVVPSQADIDAAMAAARRNVAAMNGGREPGVMPETNGQPRKQVQMAPEPQADGANGVATPATPTKRKGFMGSMLGRRRTSSTASVPQIPSNYFASPAASVAPQSPAAGRPQSPTGKLQRRTTKRNNSSMSAVPQSSSLRETTLADQSKPATPGPASVNSQNWPLTAPPRVDFDGDQRPATSDGVDITPFRKTMRGGGPVGRAPRPELGRRSISGGDLDRTTYKNTVYSEKTGKKKRFGALRNLFGLKD